MSVTKRQSPLPPVDTAAHAQSLSTAVASVEDARVGALQQLAAVRAAKNVNLTAERDFYVQTFGASSSAVTDLDQRIAANTQYATAFTTAAQKAVAPPASTPGTHVVHGTVRKKGAPARGHTVRLVHKNTVIEEAECTPSNEHGYFQTTLRAEHLRPFVDAKTSIAEEGEMVEGLALALQVLDAEGHVVARPTEEIVPEAGGVDHLAIIVPERAKAPSTKKR